MSDGEGSGGLISHAEWERPSVRWGIGSLQALLLVGLVVFGLGPILWLTKSAITPTLDTITHPMGLFPHGTAWSNLKEAWTTVHVGRYFWNTVVLAFGSWASQLVVAATGGFALSVLRPKYATLINGLLLTTLFVPAVVLLVPLYIEIVHPPLVHHSFIDSYWAVWLPAGASAFNVVLVKRFFDNLPREIFEAARIDGAGPFRLFWSIVLPMSKPILGVVSIFAVLASWKDFLWPLLVEAGYNPTRETLNVGIWQAAQAAPQNEIIAASAMAAVPTLIFFLIFQRNIMSGLTSGGLKG